MLLHVVDAAAPHAAAQRTAVLQVLRQLGVPSTFLQQRVVEVWNKADLLDPGTLSLAPCTVDVASWSILGIMVNVWSMFGQCSIDRRQELGSMLHDANCAAAEAAPCAADGQLEEEEETPAAARVLVSVRTKEGVPDLLSQLDSLVAKVLRAKHGS